MEGEENTKKRTVFNILREVNDATVFSRNNNRRLIKNGTFQELKGLLKMSNVIAET